MTGSSICSQFSLICVLLGFCHYLYPICAQAEADRIQVRDKWLVDSDRRIRLFHGFNSVQKGPPWFDENILNETRLSLYQQWGFNVVRLGMMWAGCEPADGRYNLTYMNIMQEIVDKLEAHGLYVILDVHQDVMSSKFDSYDGVPRWLVDKFPSCSYTYPWPFSSISQKDWSLGYLTAAVSEAFQQLYDNVTDSLDSFANFWQTVAKAFHKRPSVLGYELINEPWAGNIYSSPSLLLPGVAGRKNLAPVYQRLNAAIREVDNDTLIFYEPVTWGVYFSSKDAGSGFDSVPGGPDYRNRSVFSYHYYCWIIDTDSTAEAYPWWERTVCDKLMGSRVMPSVLNDISRLGGSAFLTEFGLCQPNGDPASVDTVECEFVLSQADQYLQSWTYWDSGFFDSLTGDINKDVVLAFARVYPTAVAGEPVVISFDVIKKSFYFEYVPDLTIKKPTEILVPLIHYPAGFNVTLSDGLKWSFDKTTSKVYVVNAASSVRASRLVFVSITPSN